MADCDLGKLPLLHLIHPQWLLLRWPPLCLSIIELQWAGAATHSGLPKDASSLLCARKMGFMSLNKIFLKIPIIDIMFYFQKALSFYEKLSLSHVVFIFHSCPIFTSSQEKKNIQPLNMAAIFTLIYSPALSFCVKLHLLTYQRQCEPGSFPCIFCVLYSGNYFQPELFWSENHFLTCIVKTCAHQRIIQQSMPTSKASLGLLPGKMGCRSQDVEEMADFSVNCVNVSFLHFLVHCPLPALLPSNWAQEYRGIQLFQWFVVIGYATFLPECCFLSRFLAIAPQMGVDFHLLANCAR